MKKTHIYKLLFVSALLATVSSCKKPLDIDPRDTIDQSMALVTSKDVEVALVGSYSDLGNSSFYGGELQIMSDFLANRNAIRFGGTFEQLTQVINKSILKSNSFVNDIWRYGYKTINDVNNVISAIDRVDAAKKDKVNGEAKFIRGTVYFELVRVFAKAYNDGSASTNPGVPIVLTPTNFINDDSYVTRATVAAVYQQVIADLTAAEAALPDENGFFATKSAAAGMLARVYLQMGNYTEAANAANRVIGSGNYSLTATFEDAFPTIPEGTATPGLNSTEDVFATQVTTLTGGNALNTYYETSDYGGRGDATISQDWIDANYEEGDDRLTSFYEDGDVFTYKFANQFGNVPIIRLAEMYLIRAECNARLASASPIGGATPLEDLAMVRTRAGLTTTSATVADILQERIRELSFEGFSLHDAKRTQTNIGNLPWNANNLVFPIPQRETDANKSLTQNPGY